MKTRFSLLLFFVCTTFILKAQDSIPGVTKLLDLSLEELMNIKVVTATGYLQTTSEAPSTITVITAQQIAERGYEQLEDALRDVPGIDMIHINGYAPTLIYFRGMYGAENLRALLMIDGIVENNILGSNDMGGPVYSLHNVERVEIIWGPVSALYGANAFGGVINIITKKGADIDGLHFEQGIGSFNTSFQKLDMGVRKDKFELAVAGTLYSTDGPIFKNRDPNYSDSYVDKAYSLNTTLSYYSKRSKTTVGYRVYRTPMGWGTYANSPTVYLHLPSQGNNNLGIGGVLQREIRGEKPGKLDSYLRTWFIQNEFKPNNKWNFSERFTYRETGQAEDSYVYVTGDGRKLFRVPIASYSNRVEGELSANYSPSAMHHFSAGVQYFQDNVEQGSRGVTVDFTTVYLLDGRDTLLNLNSTFLPRKFDIRDNFGSYFQYALSTNLLKKTDFTFGVRYDNNSYFGSAVSPRIVVVNQPTNKLTFKLQFGTAFRAPSNLEIHQTPPSGNFQLDYERIKTYEANVIYTSSKNLRLQLNGFYNKLTDVIVLGNLPGPSLDKNPAEFEISGAEGIVETVLTKNVSGFANFTYMHTHAINLLTGVSGKLPAIPNIKGNAGITMHVQDLLMISVLENFVGKRPVQRTNPFGPVDAYLLTDFVISTSKLFKEKVTASLNIHNLFNSKWLDPGFRTADGSNFSTVLEQPGINGIFKIGITL